MPLPALKTIASGILASSGTKPARIKAPVTAMMTFADPTRTKRGTPRCISQPPIRLPVTFMPTTSAEKSAAPMGPRPWVSIRKVGSHAAIANHWIVKSRKAPP